LALAIHFDRLIREGAVGSYPEIARLTGASPALITAIMKLADLPVPEQEILIGFPSESMFRQAPLDYLEDAGRRR